MLVQSSKMPSGNVEKLFSYRYLEYRGDKETKTKAFGRRQTALGASDAYTIGRKTVRTLVIEHSMCWKRLKVGLHKCQTMFEFSIPPAHRTEGIPRPHR